MSPRVRKKDTEEEPGVPTTPPTPDAVELEEALAQLPDGTVAKLYKVQEDGAKAFVTQSAPAAMTEERIAKAGPGKYVVVFWGALGDGTNRKGYRGQRSVTIAEGFGAVSGPVSNPDGSPATPPAPSGLSTLDAVMQSQLLGFFEMTGKQRQIETALIERLVNQPTKGNVDWGVLFAAVSPIILALINNMASRKDPLDQAREIARLSVEERGPTGNPVEQLRSMLALMKEIQTGKSANGDGDDNDGETPAYLRVFEKVGVPLLERLLQPSGQSASPATAVVIPERESTPVLPPESANVPPILTLLRQHIPALVRFAEQDRDPTWVAETLLYEVPKGMHALVAQELNTDMFLMQITTAFPELRPFMTWVDEVRVALVQTVLNPDGEEEGEKTDTTGE